MAGIDMIWDAWRIGIDPDVFLPYPSTKSIVAMLIN